MLWKELIARVPRKVCGENRVAGQEGQPCRNITECKFGTTCQDGKCQKINCSATTGSGAKTIRPALRDLLAITEEVC